MAITNAAGTTSGALQPVNKKSPWQVDDPSTGDIEYGNIQEHIQLPDNPMLKKAEAIADQWMSGEIPDDVAREIKRTSLESSSGKGIRGMAGRDLVARDLGLTSMDIQQKGVESGLKVGELQTNRDVANAELNLNIDKLNESMREWDEQYATMLKDTSVKADSLRLSGQQLISDSQIKLMSLTNELLINNSIKKISDVQTNIDDITAAGSGLIKEIRKITGGF